jgi:hypothetical protein
MKKYNLAGKKFGKLTAIESVRVPEKRDRGWMCVCECGNKCFVSTSSLLRTTRSCGCWKHGMKGTPTWESWRNIKYRCGNKKCPQWGRYGGRGILVCDRWKNSFKAFLEDMGTCPEGMTIHRVDNDGNYEPGNCVWATKKTQARNRRSNKMLTIKGVTKSLIEWSECSNVNYVTILSRVNRGWCPECSMTIPPNDGECVHC